MLSSQQYSYMVFIFLLVIALEITIWILFLLQSTSNQQESIHCFSDILSLIKLFKSSFDSLISLTNPPSFVLLSYILPLHVFLTPKTLGYYFKHQLLFNSKLVALISQHFKDAIPLSFDFLHFCQFFFSLIVFFPEEFECISPSICFGCFSSSLVFRQLIIMCLDVVFFVFSLL